RQRKGHGLQKDRVRPRDVRQPKKQETPEHEFPPQQLADGLAQEWERLDILTPIIVLESFRMAQIPDGNSHQTNADQRPFEACPPVAQAQTILRRRLTESQQNDRQWNHKV